MNGIIELANFPDDGSSLRPGVRNRSIGKLQVGFSIEIQ